MRSEPSYEFPQAHPVSIRPPGRVEDRADARPRSLHQRLTTSAPMMARRAALAHESVHGGGTARPVAISHREAKDRWIAREVERVHS